MKLRFRPAALTDLEDIYEYIAEDDPLKAGEFIALLREKCRFLAEHPFSGRARPEIRHDTMAFLRSPRLPLQLGHAG